MGTAYDNLQVGGVREEGVLCEGRFMGAGQCAGGRGRCLGRRSKEQVWRRMVEGKVRAGEGGWKMHTRARASG